MTHIHLGDCTKILPTLQSDIALTFLDPPFNQGKTYTNHDDDMEEGAYWDWMGGVCKQVYDLTLPGGAVYFMQREKNAADVMGALGRAGWHFQNLIIWKKKSSAVPLSNNYGLAYQILVYATKGDQPRIFNKLRIDPPLLVTERYKRPNGVYVTNVWSDIRELTSGYLAGNEPLRDEQGQRFHKQQAPIDLLLRIILSSTMSGDFVLDPFAGTGTTLLVADQLSRESVGIEIDPENINKILARLSDIRTIDNLDYRYEQYHYTENLSEIWGRTSENALRQLELFKED